MQAFMEGARFTDESLRRAQQAPAEELPVLTDGQLSEAKAMGASPDRFARSLYAGILAEPEWAERIKKVGAIVDRLLSAKLPGAAVTSVTLQTSRGLFRVVGEYERTTFTFSIREEVVDNLLEGGEREALDRIERVVEMAALPHQRRKAS